MSLLTLEAKLERQESTTPWGFRMQGGKDFSSPITIARVSPGSLAAKCGLLQGDVILKIGNKSSETLKHKDAQDAIIQYGNKLDLLLQRGGAPSYDKFSTPSITSYQTPAGSQPNVGSQSYNKTPKPFGSTANKPSPTPYSPAVNNISHQTQNINLNSAPDYSKYADTEEPVGPQSHQSKSFKFLQDTLDKGQEPPSALRPTVDLRRSPSPHSMHTGGVQAVKQFNTPIGLYSNTNRPAPVPDDNGTNGTEDLPRYDDHGKRVYQPSETYKLIQEQENEPEKPKDKSIAPDHSRTFKALEKRLEKGEPSTVPAPPKAPAAPKPAVWSPGGQKSTGQAPAAKPFSPHVTPAPPAPKGPLPKPTGVGAVRGKIGDAVMRTGGTPGGPERVPVCHSCGTAIRGPFVLAMGKSWCPDHFVCANPRCGVKLIDIGFIEEGGFLYCEKDYEQYFAPHCAKCEKAIVGECVNALSKQYHPACFLCYQCKKPIGGGQFHLEDGNAYCEDDWRQMFQTMCSACVFPIEPGDKWVEALSSNFHSECFNCSTCQVNLEGQAFYAKAGKPYCKKHAR